MSKSLPRILICADVKIQSIIHKLQATHLKADCIFTSSAAETEALLRNSKFDLIVFQLDYTEEEKLNFYRLHLDLTKKNPVPVLYLYQHKIENLSGIEKIEPGTFDIINERFESRILFNKIVVFLEIARLRNKLTNSNTRLTKSPKLKEKVIFEKLNERTKQLSREITEHIKTKLEANKNFLSLYPKLEILEKIIESIPGPIALKNSKGKYVTCNNAFEDFLGIRKAELIGKSVFDNAYPAFAKKIHTSDMEVIKTGNIHIYETRYQRNDGSFMDLMIYKSRIFLAPKNEPGIITLVIDITQTRRAEDLLNIQYTIDYLSSLNKGLKRTLENILDYIFTLYWVDAGGIYLYDNDEEKLNLICHKGLSKKIVRKVSNYGKGSHQMDILLKGSNLFNKSNEMFPESKVRLLSEGILSVAILPLIDSNNSRVIGSLNLASKNFEEISEQDKKGIESIAVRIVNLIIYAQSQEKLKEAQSLLENKVEEKTNELNKTINALILKENEIRNSEQKYRDLQENLPIGIFSTSPDGKLLYANSAAVSIFGYDSPEEMKKVPVIDLYHSKEERNELIQTLISKGQLINTEIQCVRKDRSVFWGLIRVQTVFDSKGMPNFFDGVIEDISEVKDTKMRLDEANKKIIRANQNLEKKIQDALRKQEEQNALLIQKSKLESLGELSSGIAHEINQPLGVMALSFENLKLKITSQQLTAKYLDNKFRSIEGNIGRIRNIIDHIRTFSRDQDSFTLDKVNVNKVVGKALSMIGAQYRNHNINILLDLKEDIGFTVGSNLKLEQVILNLLSNSKYALEEKGTFIGESEFTKEILIKTDATSKKIILMIEDNGAGINFKDLSRIFDPFFTTKPEGFGTGLGLSIVYGLVKDMRGEIVVSSKEKKYTKFKISFPRFPEND
jgi:PAS domain S-box-containing protein